MQTPTVSVACGMFCLTFGAGVYLFACNKRGELIFAQNHLPNKERKNARIFQLRQGVRHGVIHDTLMRPACADIGFQVKSGSQPFWWEVSMLQHGCFRRVRWGKSFTQQDSSPEVHLLVEMLMSKCTSLVVTSRLCETFLSRV